MRFSNPISTPQPLNLRTLAPQYYISPKFMILSLLWCGDVCISPVKPMVRSTSEYSAGMNWVRANFTKSCVFGIAIAAAGVSSISAESYDAQALQKESTKRSESLLLAQELLIAGDTHYNAAEYKEATESYSRAFSMISGGPAGADLKKASSERYATAVVEYSKDLSRFGQYEKARALLNNVLADDVAPNNLAAKTMLAKLDDPIRTNPALTLEASKEAESAGKWLRKAEGYFNLGKYDDAYLAYEEVLHLDPYNKAARRGMERVNGAVSDYAAAAYDQTRAEALMQVDSQWELKVNPKSPYQKTEVTTVEEEERLQEVYANKLRQIVIPVVDFQDASISEVYEIIRIWSKEYDQFSIEEENKGVNFVLNLGSADSEWGKKVRAKRVNLNLRGVPLNKVMDFVSEATGTRWRFGQHAVVISPNGAADSAIQRRSFRVPPTFMQDAAGQATDSSDPFADDSSSRQTLSARVTAKEFLTQLGVSFPDGASAKYIPGTSTLMVSNTAHNIDLIDQYVKTYSQTENVQVMLKLTVMDVQTSEIEELGFDWLIGNDSTSNTILAGGTQGSGYPIGLPIQGANISNAGPVTSGLRSGGSMFENTLDSLSSGSAIIQDPRVRAPGIVTLTTENAQVIMRGLSQTKNVDRLDAPSIIARSGEKATLFNGREMIYPTEYEPAELPNSVRSSGDGSFPVTPSHPTAFETRDVGVNLEAEATVSEDRNYIDVSIVSEISDFDGFVDYGSPINTSATDATGNAVVTEITENSILMPLFRSIPLNTSVTVQDGSTFVIGGLNKSSVEKVEDKVPFIGDVPLVGRFFRSEGTRKSNRSLLIFITVELKDPTGRNWRDR